MKKPRIETLLEYGCGVLGTGVKCSWPRGILGYKRIRREIVEVAEGSIRHKFYP